MDYKLHASRSNWSWLISLLILILHNKIPIKSSPLVTDCELVLQEWSLVTCSSKCLPENWPLHGGFSMKSSSCPEIFILKYLNLLKAWLLEYMFVQPHVICRFIAEWRSKSHNQWEQKWYINKLPPQWTCSSNGALSGMVIIAL